MKRVSFFDVQLKLAKMRKSQYREITETVNGKVIRTYRKGSKVLAIVKASLSNPKENEYLLTD
jgi:hypothetical protein